MRFTIPIYAETVPVAGGPAPLFVVRPLFFDAPQRRGTTLSQVMTKLALDLKETLERLGKSPHQDQLAAYSFNPDLTHQELTLRLELRRRPARCRFLFVTFQGLDRKLAFTPSVPAVWFEIGRGETLHDRATEVLTRHFRDLERDDKDEATPPEDLALKGKAWVATLEVEAYPPRLYKASEEHRFAFLGEHETLDGGTELRRVGRCLDWLYPDDLDRVLYRDREVAELTRLLHSADRRPVLLIGPRQVGKTALLHECTYQAVARRRSAFSNKENLWLLSPQRLISGMSYVGQWENRLLAILKEAKKRQHLLYFDDLLGLFHAGVTGQSALNAAHVLKPYVERREVRVVAEITPEAFRVLRERDRGFADLFHLLPVAEPREEELLHILMSAMRQLEARQRCRFGLDVLPAVLDLQRRYVRGIAFPGKAAGFLRRLAVKHRRADVSRDQVIEEFHAQSGLALKLLDTRVKLERPEVLEALGNRVIGQDAALQAAADVIAIAKARLNDPDRPLASFLFLGPTGVGKTQCAKALAAFLFGDADKVVRFDMNEFVAPESVPRLVGTFYQPEGLLTAALRRQPFAVVLLDEIEKAHPDMFDLLLQVLGEGRLTDALGRTVDFTNTILILTSNLGVREAESSLGFQSSEVQDGSAFVRAAEKFFRPEFFNRLDRIVPFSRLKREDVRRIARLLIQDVFRREGLLRRRCVLHVDEQALDRVVEKGYDPLLGARALKRAIEQQLTQPVASRLAALRPETLTVVGLYPGREGMAVQVQGLVDAVRSAGTAATADLRQPKALLTGVEAAVDAMEEGAQPHRPTVALTLGQIPSEHYRYFLIREQAGQIHRKCREIADSLDAERLATIHESTLIGGMRARRRKAHLARRCSDPWQPTLAALAAAEDMRLYLKELAAHSLPSAGDIEEDLAEVLRLTALLKTLVDAPADGSGERALLHLTAPDESHLKWPGFLAMWYESLFGSPVGLTAAIVHVNPQATWAPPLVLLEGPHAVALARMEEGTHLFYPAHENLVPVQVGVLPLAKGEEAAVRVEAFRNDRRGWLLRVADGRATLEENPWPLQPVLRIYDEQGPTVDLRTGLLSAALPDGDTLRNFVLSALPLPPELLP